MCSYHLQHLGWSPAPVPRGNAGGHRPAPVPDRCPISPHLGTVGTALERCSTHLLGFIKASLCYCQISSPDRTLCRFISYWHQINRPSSFPPPPPLKNTPNLYVQAQSATSVQKYTHKLYRSQLSRSKRSYKSQCIRQHQAQGATGSPQRAWHATGMPWHGGEGRPSSCLTGSFLIQVTVQVHGNHQGRDLWAARGESAPAKHPTQHRFGSQPVPSICSAHKSQ